MKKENPIAVYQSMIADIKQIIISGQKYAYNAASRQWCLHTGRWEEGL